MKQRAGCTDYKRPGIHGRGFMRRVQVPGCFEERETASSLSIGELPVCLQLPGFGTCKIVYI